MQNIMPKVGRPPGSNTIRTMAARAAKDAVETLAKIAQDSTAPADVRVKAAETLLTCAIPTTPSASVRQFKGVE